jgi:hypothetical protein
MMRAQRNAVKVEMAYLQRKMREQLTKDTTKVMQEANDKREEEIRYLKADNKKMALAQTLLVSDFQLFKRKHATPSGAEEVTQSERSA